MGRPAYAQGRWDLEDLIPTRSGPAMEAVFASLEEAIQEIESNRDALTPTIPDATFADVLGRIERAGYLARLLNGYAALWLSEDTSNQDALAFRSRVDKAVADASNRRLFFELWWKRLDPEPAARLVEASGDLRYYLETLRRFAPFTLSEPEEKIINIKDVHGANGMTTLYDMITNAFTFPIEIDGEPKELTRTEVMIHARSADPATREAAYGALYGVFGNHAGVLGQIYSYVVGDWNDENVKLRGMQEAISLRNLQNDIPDDVVDILLRTCRDNAPVYQRYFRLKAGWLGVERLRRYDIYAPIEAASREVPFAEAVDLTFESMAGFSERMAGLAEQVLAEGHLDSEVRAGKDTGAFCLGAVPDKTPWVLMNYNNHLNDLSTLTHELGHAVHAMLASDHSPLTFRSSLPLAETASNFAEILLLNHLLATEPDPSVRRGMLAHFIDDSYGSILRQTFFVLFEREAHALIAGEGATVEQLSDRYLENLRTQFGDCLDVSDEFRHEWVAISHIYHVPFYCYAYAFGLLLVLSLYRKYEQEGEAFVPKYLRLLSYGGSKAPIEILDEAGFDIRSDAFWQGGFDVIAEMIDKLERQ
jgi:oligoendopeptidase F